MKGDPKEDGDSQRSNTDMAYRITYFHFKIACQCVYFLLEEPVVSISNGDGQF